MELAPSPVTEPVNQPQLKLIERFPKLQNRQQSHQHRVIGKWAIAPFILILAPAKSPTFLAKTTKFA
jgi:hypothetical protein